MGDATVGAMVICVSRTEFERGSVMYNAGVGHRFECGQRFLAAKPEVHFRCHRATNVRAGRCDGGEEVNGSAGVWADEQAWASLEWRLAGTRRMSMRRCARQFQAMFAAPGRTFIAVQLSSGIVIDGWRLPSHQQVSRVDNGSGAGGTLQ